MPEYVTPPTLNLPPGVEWRHDPFFGHHWLRLDHVVVAQVTPAELVGDWIVYVNRQAPLGRPLVSGRAATLGFGKKMCERWLAANFARVRAEVDLHPKPHVLGCAVGDRTAPVRLVDEASLQVPKRRARKRR